MRADSEVLTDVVHELHWVDRITADGIGASLRDGIVTLVGHVPSYAEKVAAVEAVAHVRGVQAVIQELEVRPTTAGEVSDAELATRAVHALEWNAVVPKGVITVQVEQGQITLAGAVRHEFQSGAAERALRDLAGLRGLTNDIVVSPPSTPQAIAKAKIEEAATRRGNLRTTVP